LIEDAMPQSGTNQDTEETVDEKWSEEFVLDSRRYIVIDSYNLQSARRLLYTK